MKRGRNFFYDIVMGVDLPGETLPGTPLIEIIGENRVLIESHCGVIAYCDNEICVRTQIGCVRILGSKLTLAQMTKQQLVIIGKIDCVHLQRGDR